MLWRPMIWALLLAAAPLPALAEDASTVSGGDRYEAGMNVSVDEPLARDGLLSGFSISTNAPIEGDLNALGADIDIESPVGHDAYAAGMTVTVRSTIGEDLTAAGANVRIDKTAEVKGNARLSGANVVIDGNIGGALVAAAGNLEINGIVKGDANITAGKLAFGPDARIEGVLSYRAPQQLQIAEAVVPASRIRFEALEMGSHVERFKEAGRGYSEPFEFVARGLAFGLVFGVIFLFALGATLIWFAPDLSASLVADALAAPLRSMVSGALGLAIIIGFVPVCLMTVVGIPIIPFLLVFGLMTWVGGYLLGVYAVAMRIAGAFGREGDSYAMHLIILGVGLIVFAILNYIPFIGWLVNLLAVFLGVGVVARRLIDRFAKWNAPPQHYL